MLVNFFFNFCIHNALNEVKKAVTEMVYKRKKYNLETKELMTE